jgi:uncharacterized protein YjbI with pentapeptide repeats
MSKFPKIPLAKIFSTLLLFVLGRGGWWIFVEKGLSSVKEVSSIAKTTVDINKTRVETEGIIKTEIRDERKHTVELEQINVGTEKTRIETEGIIKTATRDENKYISDLYTNVTSISTVKRQNAVDNLVQYVEEGKEDRLNAITKLAGQIKEESSVTKGVDKKSPENRQKTQILLNAIINISAEGEDLRSTSSINRIGLDSVNLYDAALISDIKNNKIRLYLSFNHSYMKESILRGLDLRNASLVDTNLDGSGLEGTILSSSNLTDSSLAGASLIGADLTHANLTRAKLKNANLTGTDISNARGITSKQISQACYWAKAIGVVGTLRPKSLPSQGKTNACNNMWLKK